MFKCLSVLLLCLVNVACAGPTTPFGSIDTLFPDFRGKNKLYVLKQNSPKEMTSQISFEPKKQNLHLKQPFTIRINSVYSKSPEKYLKIFYNNIDVTDKFLKQAHTSTVNHVLTLRFNKLQLPTYIDSNIVVKYKEPTQTAQIAEFMPPTCSIYDMQKVTNTKPFNPPQEYIDLIEEIAPRSNMNPSLISGMIAQESAFNPKAISWAKAIGLTQVTPIAEKEIINMIKKFPRYPNLNNFAYPVIKGMVLSGHVNSQQEWRLDPKLSIEGGIAYLKFIDKYWRASKNVAFIKRLQGNPYTNYSKILLASYNSGPSRVKYSIQRNGNQWLEDKKLKEAHKYVNKILSYCYHFSTNKTPLKGAQL